MRRTLILFEREIRALFTSPIAWALLASLWLLAGVIFRTQIAPASIGDIHAFIAQFAVLASSLQLILVPLLTMRLLSEERRSGTFEMLVTTPARDVEIVLAKWLATLCFLAVFLLFLPVYALVLAIAGGRPDFGPVLTSWIMLLSTGAVQVALGLFASALTRQQIVAGFAGIALVLSLHFLPLLALALPEDWRAARSVLDACDLRRHVLEGSEGVLDFVSLSTHIALAGFLLLLTLRILETRKWT